MLLYTCQNCFVQKFNQHWMQTDNINHDEVSKIFWLYCKCFIVCPRRVLPAFDKIACNTYFKKAFSYTDPFKVFTIPNWIDPFFATNISFNTSPPTYHEINKIIKWMKASGSPCPLNQKLIIYFKKCPFLQTYLWAICQEIWATKEILSIWCKATTILTYKKGDANDPNNFRPITLELKFWHHWYRIKYIPS